MTCVWGPSILYTPCLCTLKAIGKERKPRIWLSDWSASHKFMEEMLCWYGHVTILIPSNDFKYCYIGFYLLQLCTLKAIGKERKTIVLDMPLLPGAHCTVMHFLSGPDFRVSDSILTIKQRFVSSSGNMEVFLSHTHSIKPILI